MESCSPRPVAFVGEGVSDRFAANYADVVFAKDALVAICEADGVPCVDVSDPQTGTNFRLYDFEYQLALQLNGQPMTEVTAWASQQYGVDLTVDGVTEFSGRLDELGFLEAAAGAEAAAAAPVHVPGAVTAPVGAELEASEAVTSIPAQTTAVPITGARRMATEIGRRTAESIPRWSEQGRRVSVRPWTTSLPSQATGSCGAPSPSRAPLRPRW